MFSSRFPVCQFKPGYEPELAGEGVGKARSTDSGAHMLGSLPKTLISLTTDPDQLNEPGSQMQEH